LALARKSLTAFATLKDLDGRTELSDAEQSALRGWSGWGPLALAVDRYRRQGLKGGWIEVAERVTELLTPEEEQAAKEATATSFYTPAFIAHTVWNILTRLGFSGGRVLEPGCGSGNLIAAAPADLPVQMTGVELDPTSARIAALLWPQADIINKPLERTAFRLGAFSAAVGNVPFAKETVYDATWPEAEAGFSPALHWYCIWRALKAMHPGGIAVLIVSRYAMDSANPFVRAHFSRMAEFVGAIRLPTGAFGSLGFTGLADILVLRRRPYLTSTDVEVGAWASSEHRDDLLTTANDYWYANPDMVLGQMGPRGGAKHGATMDVLPPAGADVRQMLERAVDKLVAHAHESGLTWQPPVKPLGDTPVTLADEKEGSFHLKEDGAVTQVLDGSHQSVPKASDELKQLILLRDAALDLFEADADLDRADVDIEPIREHTRRLYEAYVERYGPLNRAVITVGAVDEETGFPTINRRTPNLGGFRGVGDRPGDPDYPTVLALGVWNEDEQSETPAPILLRRVNRRPVRKTRADNPAEAVALCWDEFGKLDLPHMARLLGVAEADMPGHLAGVAFEDPDKGRWVPAEEYLSGNVREKLKTVTGLAELAPERWSGNVAALVQVQPVDLDPSQIAARLGAPWIPVDVVKGFICAAFGLSKAAYRDETEGVTVRHEKITASWEVFAPLARKRPTATTTYGTDRFNAVDLIEKALNGTAPVAYDEIQVPDPDRPGKTKSKRVKNQADTQLAEERTKQLQELFSQWVWSNPERTERLCRIYNDRYNAVRLRKFDGSMFTFPGLMAGFDPYAHQKAMVARIVASPSTVCAHSVGAGKTTIMIMAAMTMKRLGLVNKPCVTVPNHLLEQVAAEFRQRYPTARILMVTKADLTPKRRKYFAAKVAAADWDMIVMTYQQFTSIPVSPAVEAEFLADQIEELEAAVGDDSLDGSRTVKRLAKMIIKLKQRHAELTHIGGQNPDDLEEEEWEEAPKRKRKRKKPGRDDGLFFDLLGIDFLMVDEFHYFKNLYAATRVEGFSMPASKRAEDLFMKISWLRERNPDGRCFAGFTGTPISNTLAEAFTALRYMFSRAWMKAKDLYSFDAFAGMFITFETKIEVSPDGSGFRMHRRPAKFVNVPELRVMLGEGMDVRTRHQLKLAGPGRVLRHAVTVQPQPELKPFIEKLVERADDIRRGKPMEMWSEAQQRTVLDNMLSICNDGRKAALWLPLVGLDSDEPGKPETVAATVAAVYHRYKNYVWPDTERGLLFGDGKPGGFQMVFCDLGTPNKDDAQVYGHMRDLLVEAGVPRTMIRFVHDAKTDLERALLFKQCREGEVAVLFVSTEKGGTGVNAQNRLVAIHHMDAPWRPSDVEQRDGRGDRPGNMADTLEIFRYVVEGSFDSYMWQHLERKSYFIFQILSGEFDVRQVDDVTDESTLDYAHIKAMATGQEAVLKLAEAQAEVARLQNLANAHRRDLARLKADQHAYTQGAQRHEGNARALEDITETAANAFRQFRDWYDTIDDEQVAAERLAEAARGARADRGSRDAGSWRGVQVRFEVSWLGGRPLLSVRLAGRRRAWAAPEQADIVLLRKGNEKFLLAFIDKAIERAKEGVHWERERAQALQERADEITPELQKVFGHELALKAALAERKRLEDLIAAEMAPVLAQAA
jgi:N12 class adenine-specific DNA methylase